MNGETIVKWAMNVLLDTDRNPSTGDNGLKAGTIDPGLASHGIGADYMVDPMVTADLWEWSDAEGWHNPISIPFRIDGNSLELAVPLSDIGDPTEINIVFLSNPPDTDYAPDEGYVTYRIFQPVGGTILSVNKLELLIPLMGLCSIFGIIGYIVAFKRRVL